MCISKNRISYEEANRTFKYDPETGIITWKITNSNKIKVGEELKNKSDPSGYIKVKLWGKNALAHRIAYLLMTGEHAGIIDHINGNRSDNRWCNLRVASKSENCHNRKIQSNSSTGYKGVWYRKDRNQYQSQIQVNGKKIYVGMFDTAEEAHLAYQKKSLELHGEFSNFG